MTYIGLPELIADIAVATGHSQGTVRSVIGNFLLQIEGARFRQNAPDVRIKGFGKFWFAETKAREIHNPRTGKAMRTRASRRLRFTPSKALIARIQDKRNQEATVVVLKKRRAVGS